MATIPRFDIRDTNADEKLIAAAAEQFDGISGRITGRGGDLRDMIQSGVVEFSEIVAEPMRKQKDYSEAAWLKATQGSVWGASVSTVWAGNVKDFKEARQAYLESWDLMVNDNFGVTPPNSVGGTEAVAAAWEKYDTELQTEANAKYAEMKGYADDLVAKFEQQAAERGQELRQGPTKENLARLVDAGGLGFAGFNLWGTKAPMPLGDLDGEELARLLALKFTNGGTLTEQDRQALLMLQGLAERAAWLQANGGKLTEDELTFLEDYYGTMGLGISQVEDYIDDYGQFMKPGDEDLLRGGIGGGFLALSNEDLGGGYDRLPDPVTDLLNRSEYVPGDEPGNLWGPIAAMAPVLAAGAAVTVNGKKSTLVGGKEFSERMTFFVADQLHPLKGAELKAAEQLLDVSLANTRANAAILAGDAVNFHDGADSRERVLRELWGKEWSDDGETAAKLTNWIPEAAASDDKAMRELAGRASLGLFDTVTKDDPTVYKTSAFEFFTDGFGKAGGDPAAPIGSANPKVVQSLTGAMSPYLPTAFTEDPSGLKNGWKDGDLDLDENTRRKLFQIAMSDEKSADALGAMVYSLAETDLKGVDGWNNDTGDDAGARNGRLLGYLDAGLDGLINDKAAGLEELGSPATKTDERVVRWSNMGAAVAKEAFVDILPGGRSLEKMWKIGFELAKTGPGTANAEGWWSTVDMPGSGGGDRGEQAEPDAGRLGETQLSFRRAAVEGLIEQNRIDLSDLDPTLVKDGRLVDIDDIPAGQARDEARKDLLKAITDAGAYDAYDAFEDGYQSWKGDASGRDYPGGANDGNGN